MKRTLTLFILALTAWSASAQHQINFHQGAATYSYPLTEGDSLYFDSSNATMYFLNNGTLLPFVVGTIDSITATPANSQAVYIHYQGSSVTFTNPLASSGVSVTDSGAFVTINAAGGLDDIQYICWGATSNGNLKIYSDSRFNLLLRGLSISNP
ncbi:MAG TPA: hypothetical protein P5550_01005, partial [Bacteroidales bacterium]|nr:hypothetical protein [Bacteroidales bacterium]